MNLVGKIFVFLIMCMSLVFMAFGVVVYSTHTSWRAESLRTEKEVKESKGLLSLGLKYQLENEKKKNDALDNEKAELEKQIAAIKAAHLQALSKLETEKSVLVAQSNEAQKSNSEMQATLQGALDKVQIEQKKFNALQAERDTLREEIKLARGKIDSEFSQVVVLTEQMHAAMNDLQRAEIRKKELADDVAKATRLLHSIDTTLTINTPPDYKTPPPIDGLVTGVRVSGPDTYAQLSIGSDVGVRIGHSLEIYRGNLYVGKLNVIRTTPDGAVGKVDKDSQKADVLRGDRVESRRSLKLTSG
ncbi:MAG: hypothetical protein K8T25_05625 [Planctomycetia bacterium]|nr:hypothetical protein [Planctomycetia bacterium]